VIAMPRTDTHEIRLRRASDAVLTEMARSLMREDRPAEDASAGRSTAAQAEDARHAAQRFRRPALSRPSARIRAATLS
jgi:hypothetical protein